MTKSNVKAEPKKDLIKKKEASKVLKPAKQLKNGVNVPKSKNKAAVVRISNLATDITERQISQYFHQNFPTFKFSRVRVVESEETGQSTGIAHINFKKADSAEALVGKKITFLNDKPLCATIVPPEKAGGLFITKKIPAEGKPLSNKSNKKQSKVKASPLKKPAAKEVSDEDDSNSSDAMDVSIDNSLLMDDEATPKKGKAKKPSKNLTDKKKGGGIQKKVVQKNKKGGAVVSKANKMKMGASEIMKKQEVPKVKKINKKGK